MAGAFDVHRTSGFSRWLESLKSPVVRAAVLTRLLRLGFGNPGDVKAVGSGVSELRISLGPGYRVYYIRVDGRTYLVLGGGDKSSQARDIKRAIAMADELRSPPRPDRPRKPK